MSYDSFVKEALIKSLSAFIRIFMQCKEWDDANSELFKESHDEAVHKNSYKSRLYELISASLKIERPILPPCKRWDNK